MGLRLQGPDGNGAPWWPRPRTTFGFNIDHKWGGGSQAVWSPQRVSKEKNLHVFHNLMMQLKNDVLGPLLRGWSAGLAQSARSPEFHPQASHKPGAAGHSPVILASNIFRHQDKVSKVSRTLSPVSEVYSFRAKSSRVGQPHASPDITHNPPRTE